LVDVTQRDLIVVGAGVAGFTAGIYGARSGLETLILEENVPGGTTADAPLIENYPGFPKSISGRELTGRMLEHAKSVGVKIQQLEKVTKLKVEGEEIMLTTDKAVYSASAVILATGTHYNKLGVSGEDEYRGRGVSYCAVCDGPFFKGKNVVVVGGGNSAGVSAIYLSNLASDVKLVHRRDQLRAEEAHFRELQNQNVEILWNTEVKEIKGNAKVESIVLFNNKTSNQTELKVDGVFVQIGETPNSEVAEEAGVKVDEHGYIVVDQHQRTNLWGVYAAGDVTTCPVKQVGTAVGQAIIAATEAFGYIKRPYYYKG
jgi:thioredoxin reductase (NADPH)